LTYIYVDVIMGSGNFSCLCNSKPARFYELPERIDMNGKRRFVPENHSIGFTIEPVPCALKFKSKNGGPLQLRRFWRSLGPWLRWGVLIVAALYIGTFCGWLFWKAFGFKF
jgi:hypothetical protein